MKISIEFDPQSALGRDILDLVSSTATGTPAKANAATAKLSPPCSRPRCASVTRNSTPKPTAARPGSFSI